MDFNNDSGALQNVSVISPASSGVITFSGTGAFIPPTGATGSRPLTPTAGALRYNSDINDLEFWNGSAWTSSTTANSMVSFNLSSWILASGNLYYADVVHNLGTQLLTVTLWDNATNTIVQADSVRAINTSTLRITVASNTANLQCVIIANGSFVGYTATPIRTLTYYASSLDSPNNADWAVNSLAAAISDPNNTAITVRQFSNTIEQGVGFNITVPSGATAVTFRFKGRSQIVPTTMSVVQPKLYIRAIPNNAAIGAWSTAYNLSNISIPTNNFVQYSAQSFSLAGIGIAQGGLYQCELTRATTVSGGTQLAANWYLNELTVEFT